MSHRGRHCNVCMLSCITSILCVEIFLIFKGLPSQEGNGLSHFPSLPHISIELPFRYVPGFSHLKLRKRSGSMGPSLSGKPFIFIRPFAGGGSQLKAE